MEVCLELTLKALHRAEHYLRKHVFADLQPYVCTFLNCPKGNELYGSQREWFEHEVQLHRREWYCNTCSRPYLQRERFQEHIKAEHPELVTEGYFETVISRCERAIVSGITCPLCGMELTLQTLEKHLGLHLQEVALFALPLPEPGKGSTSMKAGHSNESSSEYLSRKSSFGFGPDIKQSGDLPVISPATIPEVGCICSYQHDDGFLVTCSNCKGLQHGTCMGINKNNFPEVYECSVCNPGVHHLEIEVAIIAQEDFLQSYYRKQEEKKEGENQVGLASLLHICFFTVLTTHNRHRLQIMVLGRHDRLLL